MIFGLGAPASLLSVAGAVPQVAASVNIDFDKTFLFQMVLFALLVYVLKPLLFEPVLRIFEEREKRTDGVKAEARAMQERAGELLRKYERELERVNRAAAEERERIRVETAKLEAKILTEARESVQKILDDGRARIDEQATAIRFDLGKESEKLSREIATTVLGREVS